jgi:Dolichyl-phosphate-mannose-protein mannosyltransferase
MKGPRGLSAVLPIALAFLVARSSLHRATFALPVSNDDAVLLLMARHILRGELATILWNQPYNGALDAYLLAPFLVPFEHHLAFRLYELVCAALLVLLVWGLARRMGGRVAGLAGALLAAWGTPYMALMTATGPPPNFLMPLVTGFPLVAALGMLDRDVPPPRTGVLVGLGVVCGLAVWNSSLAIPAFTGMAAGLLLAGLRPRVSSCLTLLAGFAVGASPLVVARFIQASGSTVETAASAVTALRPRWLWLSGLQDLGAAAFRLVGLEVPLVVDGPEHEPLPLAVRLCLGTGLALAVGLGLSSRRVWPLLGWAAALAGAFALSRRTGPDDLRYLYGLNAPLLALAGVGLARAWSWRRPAGVALGLAVLVPWGLGDRILASRWSDPAHAVRVWQVPAIDAPISSLEAQGLRSAYASLQFATRLTLESGEKVVASQAWNERIPGDPLRFRDEVDLDPRPAYVLHPALSRGMPRAAGFREQVQGTGGSFREERAGDFFVFSGFRPPFLESRPVPAGELVVETVAGEVPGRVVLDRDPATAWTSRDGLAKGAGLVVACGRPRRLGALVALVDLDRSPLAVPWIASIEGEVVASGPARQGLQWVNGAPRAGKQALFVVLLGDRPGREVRLIFQGAGPPLSLAEVFLYGPDEAEVAPAGDEAARRAYEAARAGDWTTAEREYREAVRLEPDRASHHASWARSHWRAPRRRWLDVESLDDGGPELVLAR